MVEIIIMDILHINCNYMDSWLHQTMIETLDEMCINNSVFVPVFSLDGHIVYPNSNVNEAVCFKKWDRIVYHNKQKKILNRIQNDYKVDTFDLIHAYTVFTDGNVARNLLKRYGVPYVVAVRNTDVNTFFKKMPHLRHVGVNVLKDASAVFFLSESYKNEIVSKYLPEHLKTSIIKKSIVLPNGIDSYWFENIFKQRLNCRIQQKFDNRKMEIVYAGGIDENKNVKTTCDAVDILKNRKWDVRFRVVGKIKNKSVFSQIEDRIIYYEAMPKNQLIELYRNADVFVMPSHAKTFGLVYAEAMSQGLPVIYTRGQGFDGQFPDGMVGYAVDDNNPTEIADKVEMLIQRYPEVVGNCIDNVSKFKWDDICKEYCSIYKRVKKNE